MRKEESNVNQFDKTNRSYFNRHSNTTISVTRQGIVIDLQKCEDRAIGSRILIFGSEWVGVLDAGEQCHVYFGGEMENPKYNGEGRFLCSLKKDLGKVTLFDVHTRLCGKKG